MILVNVYNFVFVLVTRSTKKRFAEWTAKDFVTDDATRRTFRVMFSSELALEDFIRVFQQVSTAMTSQARVLSCELRIMSLARGVVM